MSEWSGTKLDTGDQSLARELAILEAISEDPGVRQADLAMRLGVAVGTVNWLMKRLISKGWVKAKRIGRWQWRYLITPRGLCEKARLAQQYVRISMRLYRQVRQDAKAILAQAQRGGYRQIALVGESGDDVMDICRLTCLELGVAVVDQATCADAEVPKLKASGGTLRLEGPGWTLGGHGEGERSEL